MPAEASTKRRRANPEDDETLVAQKKFKKELKQKSKKYVRGDTNELKSVADKKLKGSLKRTEEIVRESIQKAARSEILLPEQAGFLESEGMEKTQRLSQAVIGDHVDLQSSKKIFDLKLDTFGPYNVTYSRNGRFMLMGGAKGHLAVTEWSKNKLATEIHVREAVKDVTFLHNEDMWAAAQKKYVYIYDSSGIELHVLKNHVEPTRLDFLPYHYLLVSVGRSGYLKYQDTSTGQLVAECRTKLGACDVLRQNSHNAVMCLGHNNGQVSMWTPNLSAPVVKMLCHHGPVKALSVDRSGTYMATAGLDRCLKIWDLRTYMCVNTYYTHSPAHSLDISQRGLVSVAFGPNVEVWKDMCGTAKQQAPYVKHRLPGSTISGLRFCPYEDVLGIGHSNGISSILVPGAGEANFDAFEANPFETKKQKRETVVHSLLEKLQPEMISLDPEQVATVARTPEEKLAIQKGIEDSANKKKQAKKEKNRMRGRNKIAKRLQRKQANVVDEARERMRQQLADEKAKAKEALAPAKKPSVLDRFQI